MADRRPYDDDTHRTIDYIQQAAWATRKQALWLKGEAELWAPIWDGEQAADETSPPE